MFNANSIAVSAAFTLYGRDDHLGHVTINRQMEILIWLHNHLLFFMSRLFCLCCVITVKSFPVLAFNIVIITSFVRLTLIHCINCIRCVIVIFPDHTHLLFLASRLLFLCCVVNIRSFPILLFNVVIITIVRIYT